MMSDECHGAGKMMDERKREARLLGAVYVCAFRGFLACTLPMLPFFSCSSTKRCMPQYRGLIEIHTLDQICLFRQNQSEDKDCRLSSRKKPERASFDNYVIRDMSKYII